MILKYRLTDNHLKKKDVTEYPNHFQNNITLEFEDTDGILNNTAYAYIKTHNIIEKIKINNTNGNYSCELPTYVTHQTFFKLKIVVFLDEKHRIVTNELIIPIRVDDYLDYNRSVAHSVSKQRINSKAIYDEHMDRYDGLWKYPVIPKRVKNV